MADFPKTELIVKVNDEIVLHLQPLDENGMGMVLAPGQNEEAGIAAATLVAALAILAGPRPDGQEPNITVVQPKQLGLNDDGSKRGSHLSLVRNDEPA